MSAACPAPGHSWLSFSTCLTPHRFIPTPRNVTVHDDDPPSNPASSSLAAFVLKNIFYSSVTPMTRFCHLLSTALPLVSPHILAHRNLKRCKYSSRFLLSGWVKTGVGRNPVTIPEGCALTTIRVRFCKPAFQRAISKAISDYFASQGLQTCTYVISWGWGKSCLNVVTRIKLSKDDVRQVL